MIDWLEDRYTRLRESAFCIGNPVRPNYLEEKKLLTDKQSVFDVQSEQLARHMAVLGASGSGKSKFLESLCRHLFDSCCGTTFIDPHGDTAEAVLAYVAKQAEKFGPKAILPRFHYLTPSVEWLFSFDPLRVDEDPENTFAYAAALQTAVAKLVRIILRSEAAADEEKMRRLKRWLSNGLTVIGTPLPDGSRLSFAELPAVLYPNHERHDEIIAKYRGLLPKMTQLDFDFLESLKRPQDRDSLLESTLNRINDFCSVMSRAVFGLQAPSADFFRFHHEQHFTVVNLREIAHQSAEAADSIADFIINVVRNVAAEADESERVPHTLIIDEASRYMADDLGEFLDEMRKYKLSVCLGAQHLSNFQKGDIDITDQLMGNCKTFISFQQRSLIDVKMLAEFFGKPNLVLQERMQVMDRPYKPNDEIITLVDHGESTQNSLSDSLGVSIGKSHSKGKTNTTSTSTGTSSFTAESYSTSTSSHESESVSNGRNSGSGHHISTSASYSPIMIDGQLLHLPSHMDGNGLSDFSGESQSASNSSGTSTASSESTALGTAESESSGHARSVSYSSSDSFVRSLSVAISEAFSQSVTHKQQLVPGTKEFWYGTGDARFAIPYQYAIHEYLLTTLPPRYAFVRSMIEGIDQTCVFRVGDVHSPFSELAERDRVVSAFKEQLFASKPYMFRSSRSVS